MAFFYIMKLEIILCMLLTNQHVESFTCSPKRSVRSRQLPVLHSNFFLWNDDGQRSGPDVSSTCINNKSHLDKDSIENQMPSRRDALDGIIKSMFGMSALTFSLPENSHAACLAGDTSLDCIGVYKVPIDDQIKNMVSTPEQLAKFAPDLRYVPPIPVPNTYKEAKEEILALKENVNGLTAVVSKGDLTSAGVEILRIVPRITVAGRVVISSLGKNEQLSMKAFRSDVAHNELLASLGAVDVMIGQSIAGQLGSITAAQIQILEELRNANEHYDELVKAMPSEL